MTDITTPTRVDLNAPAMTARFATSTVYAKTAVVDIREVEPGTVVDTVLADGTVETTNTATIDRRWLVTNPGGETYLITTDSLDARYTAVGDGKYRARGLIRAFRNDTGGPVVVAAPWGEDRHGGPGSWFAATVDPAHPDMVGGDRYLIGGDEFAGTYAPFRQQP